MSVLEDLRLGPARLGWRAIPGLMRAGTVFGVIFAGIFLAFLPLAAFDVGKYTINERPVTGPYFLTHAYPILAPFLAMLIAISYGIWTEKLWARPLALLLWVAVCGLMLYVTITQPLGGGETFTYGLSAVAYVAGVWWYFYRKRTVALYYERLLVGGSPAAGA